MATKPPSQGRPVRTVVVALAGLAITVIPALTVWGLLSHRAQIIADTETRTRNLARIFAGHAARSFGETSRVVEALAQRLKDPAALADSNEPALHTLLREQVATEPQLLAIGIINQRGTVVATNFALGRRADVSDRSYFQKHKSDPSPTLAVGPPMIGRGSLQPMISLSRRLSAPDGQFMGAVMTSLSQNYFTNVYASVDLGSDSVIELVNESGLVLLRNAPASVEIDRRAETWERLGPLPREGIRTARMTFASDGIERIVSMAPVDGYPLAAQVAISVPYVLGPWRAEAYKQAIAAGLAVLGLLALCFFLLRQYQRLADSEAAARRNAEVLDKTIASMADALLVVDAKGQTVFANPALVRLFGDQQQVGSAEWQQTYHRFYPDGVRPMPAEETPIGRAIRGLDVDNLELVMRRGDESESTHIIANGRTMRDASGALTGAVIVYRDATEATETERQLRQAQKMDAVGQLTGGIAHDFNNMLTVITGSVDILADGVAFDPKLTEITKMIDQAAERGTELTRHLLAFARKQPLQPRETDINKLIMETGKLLRPALGEQVEIESMLEDDAWPALVDPGQLQTALLNLAVNARDAMGVGGKLTLETGNVILDEAYAHTNAEVTPGPYVMIAVSDTGGGIPAAIRDKVFEPFFTTKAVGKGTGLGLSMVYGFVKQTGGHIKIYSEEGHGTTIKLYLPRAGGQAQWLGELAPQAAVQGGRETILVVEDDRLVRDYVIAQLESLGYHVLAAASGAEALALIDGERPIDLLFTDVILAGTMNGRQIAETALARRPDLKVLYTSGYTENAIVHHGRLDPGVLLLAKPYRKSDLARMVRRAIDGPFAQTAVA